MTRSQSLAAYIALPTMDAHTADAFVRRLLAQHALHSTTLRRSRLAPATVALRKKGDALGAALAAQRSSSASSKAAAELDPQVDSSWAALVFTLEGRVRSTLPECAAEAQAIMSAVFPDRLKFTQEKFLRQWSIANSKLQQLLVERDGARSGADFLRAYGAGDLLAEVQRLHAEFAAALGVTEGRAKIAPVELRGPMDDALDAAREFVAITLSLSATEIGDDVDDVKRDILSVIDEFATTREREEKEPPPPTPDT